MSAKLRAYVARYSALKRSAKGVLLAIAHYADDDGIGAFPSVATLIRDTGSAKAQSIVE